MDRGEFGKLLRQSRLDQRLTQSALAAQAKMSVSRLRGMEAAVGGFPPLGVVLELADALHLTGDARDQFLFAGIPLLREISRGDLTRPSSVDVFVSYASEDRDAIARPLAEELHRRGLKVWYDEIKLQLGDSLRRSIDEGLIGCRFAVVVLSPRYFAKEWTQYELDSLVSRQTGEKQKIILPIWCDVNSGEVRSFSPKLADLKAVQWSAGVGAITDLIMAVVQPLPTVEQARGSGIQVAGTITVTPPPAAPSTGEQPETAQILDTLVRCDQCTQPLNERADLPPEQRRPCPVCGSTVRAFEKYLHTVVSTSASISAQVDRARSWLDLVGRPEGPLPIRAAQASQPETQSDQKESTEATPHVEEYHGYTISSGPGEATASYHAYWFNADQRDKDVFRLEMRVSRLYARRQSEFPDTEDANELAAVLGRRWVHGLIDLGQFEQGEIYHLERLTEWEPLFGETTVTDDDLRLGLLKCLQRVQRAQAQTAVTLTLDAAGIADVLGSNPGRLEGILGELELEGLITSENATFGETLSNLSRSITGAGLRTLRQAEQSGNQLARLITVDDIDSFALIRRVTVEEVADLLPGGLLRIPEAKVKETILAIVGEPFEHRDWGGERSDVFTTRIQYQGARTPTAMLLKGPAVGAVLYPADLGKRGDQSLRLFGEPAELLIVQFNGKIESSV